jgi:hypothetical protein
MVAPAAVGTVRCKRAHAISHHGGQADHPLAPRLAPRADNFPRDPFVLDLRHALSWEGYGAGSQSPAGRTLAACKRSKIILKIEILPLAAKIVELRGFEPLTFCMPYKSLSSRNVAGCGSTSSINRRTSPAVAWYRRSLAPRLAPSPGSGEPCRRRDTPQGRSRQTLYRIRLPAWQHGHLAAPPQCRYPVCQVAMRRGKFRWCSPPSSRTRW